MKEYLLTMVTNLVLSTRPSPQILTKGVIAVWLGLGCLVKSRLCKTYNLVREFPIEMKFRSVTLDYAAEK